MTNEEEITRLRGAVLVLIGAVASMTMPRPRGMHPAAISEDDAAVTKCAKLDQIIVGGESGRGARTCEVKWLRSIRAQCGLTEVPCFIKQLGSNYYEPLYDDFERRLRDRSGADPAEWPEDLRVRELAWAMK